MRRATRVLPAALLALAVPSLAVGRDVVALLPASGINVHEGTWSPRRTC